MSNKSDDYEEFIASLLSGIEKSERDIMSLKSGRCNTLKGKSGQSHQIDVSFIDRSCKDLTMVLIECKRYKAGRVSVDVPKILKYNADDITSNPDYPDKAIMIIVSTTEFQKGARRIADYEAIRLHTVGHGPPFGFDYENILFAGVADQCTVNECTNIIIGPPSNSQ